MASAGATSVFCGWRKLIEDIAAYQGEGIGRLGWMDDPEWGPNMLQSWDPYELTGGGEFFRQAMQGKRGDRPIPAQRKQAGLRHPA